MNGTQHELLHDTNTENIPQEAKSGGKDTDFYPKNTTGFPLC